MSPGEAVRAALVANGTLMALVGGRIYAGRMPQNVTLPAVVYTGISNVPEETFESQPATVLSNARVQVDCYAARYEVAHQVAEVVDDVLSALSGDMTASRLDSRDIYENETSLHRVSVDFSVWRGR